MTPLKVEFKRDGARVSVRVLSQGENTRGKKEIFRSSEGFRLVSIALPAIHSGFANTLYVRGSCKEQDYLWSSTAVADSPRAAVEYIEKAERAIHEYNESIKEEKKMEKFRFKVWRNDYTVTMEIFEQPEETRGKGELFEYNGIEIQSVDYPELDEDCVFTRGEDLSEDNRAATIRFESLDKAEAYRKKITEALNAYAKHLEEQETLKCADKLVYQFDRIGCVVVATPIHISEWATASRDILYKNEDFIINRDYTTNIGITFDIPGVGDKKYTQATRVFKSEDAAKSWIEKATRAISECNAKYATVVEPKARLISRETVIAE